MSIVKPIVVIKYIQDKLSFGGGGRIADVSEVNKMFEKKFTDYLTFAYPEYIDELFEFQVFHPKDFTEIQYQELKTMIEESITKLQNPTLKND